jgi:hypothetical protein
MRKTASVRRLSHEPEGGAELLDEGLGLLERREVAPTMELVPVHDVGVPALGPAPRWAEDLFGKDGDPRRNLNLGGSPPAKTLPVEACGGRAAARQPIQHDVV